MRLNLIFTLILFPFLSFGQAKNDLKTLANQWDQAINNQDLRTLSGLYAESVNIYGKSSTRKEVLKGKLDFYLKYPNYSQIIVTDIKVEKLDANQYVTSFTKQYTLNNSVLEVIAYLYFSNTTGVWKIIKETDDITEKRTSAKKAAKSQIKPKAASQKTKEQFLKELLQILDAE
jgi:hypothetical protein